MLINEVDSWMTGVNTNVKGRNVKSVVRYTGSAVDYRKRLDEARRSNFNGFSFLQRCRVSLFASIIGVRPMLIKHVKS